MQRAKFWRTPAALAAFALGLAVAACSSPTNQRPEPASITLDVPDDAHDFGSAALWYDPITPLPVTVTNDGGLPTGELTVALSGAGAGDFALSANSIDSIPAGDTGTFTVGPRPGLPVGERAATVTVSGGEGAGIESRSFTVTFAVTPAADIPTFGISLSAPTTHPFASAQVGYDPITPLTVTVSNTGNQPTGALAATLAGANPGSFAVSPAAIPGIPASGSATFTVGPIAGLAEGTHAATVTVSGAANIPPQSFNVTFSVTPAPTFGISLSVTGTQTFPAFQFGYDPITPRAVTVTNTGNQPTGALTVGLAGAGAGSFAVSPAAMPSIAEGESATFTFGPNHDLPIGTHTATVTVSGGANIGDQGFDVTFTVTADAPDPTFGIILSAPALHTFTPEQHGYAAITPLAVTISNAGNQPTGELAVGLAGENPGSFALSPAAIPSIAAGGSATFTVGPNTGLAEGTHTATVTVSGEYIEYSQSFNVTFTVTPIPTFTVIFNTHGGTPVPPTQTVQEGQRATRPAQDPARASHAFVNWYAAETGGAAFDFAGTPITANTTVHARWQPVSAPPDSVSFAISFAGFASPIPGDIAGPTLNLRDGATETIGITGLPAGASVDWFFQDDPAPIANGTTLAGGTATLALNPALHGDMIGEHAVTAKVIAGGRLYSRIITFRVMP